MITGEAKSLSYIMKNVDGTLRNTFRRTGQRGGGHLSSPTNVRGILIGLNRAVFVEYTSNGNDIGDMVVCNYGGVFDYRVTKGDIVAGILNTYAFSNVEYIFADKYIIQVMARRYNINPSEVLKAIAMNNGCDKFKRLKYFGYFSLQQTDVSRIAIRQVENFKKCGQGIDTFVRKFVSTLENFKEAKSILTQLSYDYEDNNAGLEIGITAVNEQNIRKPYRKFMSRPITYEFDEKLRSVGFVDKFNKASEMTDSVNDDIAFVNRIFSNMDEICIRNAFELLKTQEGFGSDRDECIKAISELNNKMCPAAYIAKLSGLVNNQCNSVLNKGMLKELETYIKLEEHHLHEMGYSFGKFAEAIERLSKEALQDVVSKYRNSVYWSMLTDTIALEWLGYNMQSDCVKSANKSTHNWLGLYIIGKCKASELVKHGSYVTGENYKRPGAMKEANKITWEIEDSYKMTQDFKNIIGYVKPKDEDGSMAEDIVFVNNIFSGMDMCDINYALHLLDEQEGFGDGRDECIKGIAELDNDICLIAFKAGREFNKQCKGVIDRDMLKLLESYIKLDDTVLYNVGIAMGTFAEAAERFTDEQMRMYKQIRNSGTDEKSMIVILNSIVAKWIDMQWRRDRESVELADKETNGWLHKYVSGQCKASKLMTSVKYPQASAEMYKDCNIVQRAKNIAFGLLENDSNKMRRIAANRAIDDSASNVIVGQRKRPTSTPARRSRFS